MWIFECYPDMVMSLEDLWQKWCGCSGSPHHHFSAKRVFLPTSHDSFISHLLLQLQMPTEVLLLAWLWLSGLARNTTSYPCTVQGSVWCRQCWLLEIICPIPLTIWMCTTYEQVVAMLWKHILILTEITIDPHNSIAQINPIWLGNYDFPLNPYSSVSLWFISSWIECWENLNAKRTWSPPTYQRQAPD